MINREEAQKELQQVIQKDWRKRRLENLQFLPGNLRDIGLKILADASQTELFNGGSYYEFYTDAVKQLDSLDMEARIQIFSLIFPQFFSTVERAWQLFSQLPYQVGYQRKSFRLPHNPEFFSSSRCQWLINLLQVVEGYEQELTWFAVWTPYLHYYGADTLGILFAAAIDEGNEQGEEIFRILIASAKGEHSIGSMGRHVTRALLLSSCSQGWEFIENLLLAAQRQEGLRQVILETVDEAHPQAFKRIIRLILDHNLIRFSAVVRAVDVWLGLGLQSENYTLVNQILTEVSLFLEDSRARMEVLKGDVPQSIYISLWSLGFEDAISAIPYATALLNHPLVEIRFVAVYFLTQLGIVPSKIALFSALSDGDLRVAAQALMALSYSQEKELNDTNLFEVLEEVLVNFPEKSKELISPVWDWIKLSISRRNVAEVLVRNLGERTPKRLIPYISLLEPYSRSTVAEKLAKVQPWDQEIRETLFSLVGDSSQWVRQKVIEILSNCKITTEEVIPLEKLLTRKSGDLRRGILQLFLNQEETEVIATAQRLLTAKNSLQRQAGLELLQEMIQQQRQTIKCRELAGEYQANHPQIPEVEIQRLKTILSSKNQEFTLEDGLGLVDINELTPSVNPQVKNFPILQSSATSTCLISLDEVINEHRQTSITIKNWQGSREELLGNVTWEFPAPNSTLSLEKDVENLPLRDIWENWHQQRLPELRDEDGLELVRAIALLSQAQSLYRYGNFNSNHFLTQLQSALENLENKSNLFSEIPQLKYPYIIKAILTWFIRLYPPKNLFDFLLDASTISLNSIPWEIIKANSNSLWQIKDSLVTWLKLTESLRLFFPSNWQNHHQIRFWQLIQWVNNQSLENLYFCQNKVQEMMATYHAGGINKNDIIAHFILAKSPNIEEILANNPAAKDNPALLSQLQTYRRDFNDLAYITRRKSSELDPILKEIGDRLRQRILEIELQRGDIPTVVSSAALALGSVTGISTIIHLLQALEKNTLIRGYSYDNLSKSAVFSHLMRVSFPAEADTPQEFAKQAKLAKIPQKNLIDLAFYAPQWCNYVEQALDWKSFGEAVWWIHAHTKDNGWHVATEIRDTWIAQISERTPLSPQNLLDGAVDVEWFNRINQDLNAEKWQKIRESAKYASGGAAHKRSQLFAEAMLGEIEVNTLIPRITEKRHQDGVRALGLVPLSSAKEQEKDLWQRYQIIQEFIRTSHKFGSQRQASEKLAATIALENLARTAGYRDPQRLEWAMESQSVADLVNKPQTVTIDEVSVSLAIIDGEPNITINKQGKTIKSIPAKIAKNPDIIALKNRKQEINRQASRMRVSLEESLCRGDNFTPEELQQFWNHPVLLPIIKELILVGEGEIGYLIEGGKALQNYQGEITSIKSSFLKIAHPYDLFITETWHLWQQECFTKERKQAFKQVFRELYLLTPAEKATETFSNRYEGHQVNPRQALALLGKRGWITCPEEGVRKTFHNAGISVWLSFFEGFYTPADVEGLTLQGISFTKRGEWKPLKLIDIPAQLFSEVMRDLDLVVSVAHQGGVDPEASLSTVEMRSALIRETCRLLKLNNVQLQSNHVLIEGKLGSYSVHLGSAIVHRQPGGALCIIPVHSQHRGRLFLPFADDDPKTAEVVSKVLLLAKDQEIQDPTILEQI